jgi:hypothetical protein
VLGGFALILSKNVRVTAQSLSSIGPTSYRFAKPSRHHGVAKCLEVSLAHDHRQIEDLHPDVEIRSASQGWLNMSDHLVLSITLQWWRTFVGSGETGDRCRDEVEGDGDLFPEDLPAIRDRSAASALVTARRPP